MSGRELAFSWGRVAAMVLRYVYLLRSSWPRILELLYWPTVEMLLWGFMQKFIVGHTEGFVQEAGGVLIAAVLLWDILYRGQLGVSLMFFEEMYARNLGHLFVSPLRPHELVGSLLIMSILRTLISFFGAALLAIPLYQYSIFAIGLPLIVFFFNLIVFGWCIGLLVSALVLRYGLGAESLAWVAIFAVAPFSGIYYPIDVLPDWLRTAAFLLPSSHVFEGMRGVLIHGVFRGDLLATAAGLNLVYLAGGIAVFLATFRAARARGLLLHIGE